MHRTTTIGLLIFTIILVICTCCKKERLQLAHPHKLMWGGVRTSANSVGSQVE